MRAGASPGFFPILLLGLLPARRTLDDGRLCRKAISSLPLKTPPFRLQKVSRAAKRATEIAKNREKNDRKRHRV